MAWRAFWYWFAWGAAIYMAAAMIVFALRHPELTDTQRLLRIADALLWR